ncbi:uncharacterized protein LOC142162966 [Nicotiana tabacum]|uniref:Uncharacterized protein LOC142162966 n=1 Tax=Nicotiana tabacum TaxID=4097 RepID=A0AC58RUB9_TOBAC
MTRSQTSNTPTQVNIVRIRSKKCGRPEKSKEKLKVDLVNEDDVGPSVKPKRRKIKDDGDSGLDCISKEQRFAIRCELNERKTKLNTSLNLKFKLIHCILLREVVPEWERELWVKINGCLLRFGIGEFVVITGLKCVEDDATFYDKPDVNRLLKEYFPGDGKKAITRGQLLDRFKKKDWKSDEDAFKMALMIFVYHFIFSDANNHGINKDDFDIIESGQYQTYAWEKKLFEDILKTMRDRQSVRVGTNVPHILNWKVTETPTYADLTGRVIMCGIDKLNYRNISPTREEMSTLNIDTLFEVNADNVASGEVPAFHTNDSVAASPPCPQNMEQQSKRPYPQNMEQQSKRHFPQNMDRQPNPNYDSLVRIDLLNVEVEKLRTAVGKLTDTITTLTDYVVSSFEKVFSFLNMKETKKTKEDIRQHVSDDNTYGLGEFDGYQYDIVPDFVDQVNQDNVLADEGVIDGAAGDVKGDIFWDDIGDKDLAALQMSQIVLHKPSIIDVEDDYISPKQSPLAKEFCAFVDNGMDTRRSAKNIYTDEVNKLAEAFTFGSCHVTTKDWFHSLAYCGRPLIDTHLNVLFYYLRKREKYGPSVAMWFTTTDFAFGNKINSLYKDFKVNQDASVIPEGHDIEEYIRGYYCDANVSWHTVDYVLFPIYVKRGRAKLGHWVLGLFTFIDRCIHICDSNREAINDRLALDATLPYAILIPYFLKSSDFYVEKKGIDWSNGAYTNKSHSDALQINLVNNVAQQFKCDCGAFVARFTEYFILGKEIRKDNFDIETLRTSCFCPLTKYVFALWLQFC